MPTRTVDFGPRRSGLATVGYSLGGSPRTTSGVSEHVPGTGIYAAAIADPGVPTYLLWDTGGSAPRYAVEDVDLSSTAAFRSVDFGPRYSGRADVGYTLDGQPRIGHVPELLAGTGIYGTDVTPPAGYAGPIVWDTGGTTPRYAAGWIGGLAPLTSDAGRDQDVLDAIVRTLEGLGVFGGVHHADPEELSFGSDELTAACVTPDSGEETDRYDDPDGPDVTRTARWKLTLIVRDADPRTRRRTLDRLADHAYNALDGKSISGITIPDWTKLRKWKYEKPAPPEQRLTLTGEYAYFLASFAGHGTEE